MSELGYIVNVTVIDEVANKRYDNSIKLPQRDIPFLSDDEIKILEGHPTPEIFGTLANESAIDKRDRIEDLCIRMAECSIYMSLKRMFMEIAKGGKRK